MAHPNLKDDPFPEEWNFAKVNLWFKRRFEGRALREVQLLASRAAMRSLPHLSDIFAGARENGAETPEARLVAVLRCYPTSACAALVPPTEVRRFRSVVAATGSSAIVAATGSTISGSAAAAAAGSVDAAAAAYAASAAADTATAAATAIANAAYAAYAAYAVDAVDPAAAAAFEQDCRALDGDRLEAFARLPLWPRLDAEVRDAFAGSMFSKPYVEGLPAELHSSWRRMRQLLEKHPDDFAVWVEWYQGILDGEQNGRYLFGLPTARALRLNVDIALIDEELWKDPTKANAEIRRLVEVARGEVAIASGPEPSSEPEAYGNELPPDIPAQEAGPRFGTLDQKLDLIETAPPEDAPLLPRSRTLLEEMREVVSEFQAAMNVRENPNDHPRLRKLMGRFEALIAHENPDPDVVFALGLRLEEALRAAERDVAARNEPELEDDPKAALESLVRLNAIFVATTESGRELLDAAERYAYSRANDARFKNAAEPVAERLIQNDVATEKAVETILAAIAGINTGTHPHRQGLVAKTTVTNAISYLGHAAIQGVTGNAVYDAAKAIATTGVGLGALDVSAKAITFFLQYAPELAALAQAADEALRWVPFLIEWLKARLGK
jgi:hypothetical protein